MVGPQGQHLLGEDEAPRGLEQGHAAAVYEGALLKSRGRDLPQQDQRGSGVLPNSENRDGVSGEPQLEPEKRV